MLVRGGIRARSRCVNNILRKESLPVSNTQANIPRVRVLHTLVAVHNSISVAQV